jgi:hypothetical protein
MTRMLSHRDLLQVESALTTKLDSQSLDQLFLKARTHKAWTDCPVSDQQYHQASPRGAISGSRLGSVGSSSRRRAATCRLNELVFLQGI